MAQIDVTELLVDPDFIDPVTIVHRKSTVDDLGENSLEESCEPTFGSVQPASGKTLARLPEALRVANVSSFWVKGVIRADATAKYPDVLVFAKKRYQVQTVFDYSNWGAGWCEGTCVAEKPTG